MAAKISKTCSCCSEKYTSSIRTKISCGYCPYEACKPCVSRYLLSQTADAHCMSCRTGWNREFLDNNLTQTFRKGPWRNHLKQMVLVREKALLPNFQKYAAARKMYRILWPKMEAALNERTAASAKMDNYSYTVNRYPHKVSVTEDSEENNKKIMDEYKVMLNELCILKIIYAEKEIAYERITAQYNLHHDIYYSDVVKKEKREFIMKCVLEGCRGFLSSGYKCGLCATFVCKDCMLVKSEKHDDNHECKKEDVESVSLIRKETHPCPKCGIRISKIDGCDQMWCIAEDCNTAFSWNTGKVISGTVHNPHYFEWLRRTTGSVPRTPEDGACDAPITAAQIYRLTVGLPTKIIVSVGEIKRLLDDLHHVRIPQYNPVRNADEYKEFHVEYLLGEITEEKWIQCIYLRESAMERKQAIGLIIQTFHNAGVDLLRSLVTLLTGLRAPYSADTIATVQNTIADFEKLRVYINESLETLGKTVPCAVPQINAEWICLAAARLDKKTCRDRGQGQCEQLCRVQEIRPRCLA